YSGDNGLAMQARLNQPRQLATDTSGNILLADSANHRIRKISTGGTITTVVGNGILGFSGDGGAATLAQVANPEGLALDAAGNIYIGTDKRIRKVDAVTGIITTVAGTGAEGYTGDGGLATLAQITG